MNFKRLITGTLFVAAVAMVGSAADMISRNVNDLPQAAQTMLAKHFPKAEVNLIKIDTHVFGGKDYEVILANGTEVEFDGKGAWTEVDCGHAEVPASLVMKSIRDYVATNYQGAKIVRIERNSKKYEVELNNGLDLEFSAAGAFMRIDH